jgi:heme/copper-type cytochrome/quinol oxidase subunit 2
MPIEIHVVSQDAYQAWLEAAKKQFATADGVDVAQTSLVRP